MLPQTLLHPEEYSSVKMLTVRYLKRLNIVKYNVHQ